MGWGIYLYPEIYYSKVNYKCKQDVEDEIADINAIIDHLVAKLSSLAVSTEPSKMMSKEDIDNGISPIDWINRELNEVLTNKYSDCTLKDYYWRLFKLELLKDYWDNAHNEKGVAIAPPKGSFEYPRSAYMEGDFIESIYEDGTNSKQED